MRVLWISFEWPRDGQHVGGVGRYAYRLATELKELVELTVVTFAGASRLPGVEFIELPSPRTRFGRFYGSPWSLRVALQNRDFDVIHSHGDDWAVTMDASMVRSFYGTSWSEAKSSRGLRRWNHVVLAGIEKISARRADLALAIAPESMSAFDCKYVIPPIIGLPQDVVRTATEGPSVVFIGSHGGRKRGWLVESAVRDASAILGVEVQLNVIGPKSDAASWSTSVLHHSGLTDAEVNAVLGSAWVLAAPSLYEGFGIPSIEALNMGMRVIASPNPGNEYFGGISDEYLPIDIVDSDSQFSRCLADRIRTGPYLTPNERRSARELVARLNRDASAERMVEIYSEAQSLP